MRNQRVANAVVFAIILVLISFAVGLFITSKADATQKTCIAGGVSLRSICGPTYTAKDYKVRINNNGRAEIPKAAPKRVASVIKAANRISSTPYVWGGGHGSWRSSGYDCSGSVSYALHGGSLLHSPKTSGSLAAYGEAGKGKWITIYANSGHVWMQVKGVMFNTSGASPSRWQRNIASTSGYSIRHPKGL